jgi:SAM-dependent methyltransferase
MASLPKDARTDLTGTPPVDSALLPENVFGHTHKVTLLRRSCEALRVQRSPLRILDVGCGSGYAVTRFLGSADDEVLGIDLHPPNIEYANAHFRRTGLGFECRDAASLVHSRETFDVIVLADVLEHLDKPADLLAECRRLLAADGLLLVSIPNGHGPFELESALARLPYLGPALLWCVDHAVAVLNKYGPLRGSWTRALSVAPADLPYNDESGHVQFFRRRSAEELLRAAGFRIAKFTNISFLSGPFTNYWFGASPRFCRWNVGIAASLPSRLVSGWFMECHTAVSS